MPAKAQPAVYPSQRVMIVVGFPPGGPADLAARALADGLQIRFGKPVVVENRPGGGGSAAASAVARAEPDGHTLMVAGEGPISVVPALANPPYDATTGLASVGVFAEGGCTVVAVNPSFAAKSLTELIDMAKAAKEPLTYASSGLGTPSDTVAAEFAQAAGIRLKRVIYRGAAPALNDLVAGHVPLMFPTAGQTTEMIAAGKLRGLAVSTKTRCKVLPNVATMTEQGVALEAGKIWFGLFAPAAVPAAIADKLFGEVQAVAATAELAKRIETITLQPVRHASRALSSDYVSKDVAEWKRKAATIPALK
jgi:tripartite-type tricarboxylate transporter receptor subunit TctC